MPIKDKDLLAKATAHFAKHEPTPAEQTLITLFLQSTKAANAAALSKIVLAPLDWLPFRFMHEQYFRELELISLLTRATSWSVDPHVYGAAMQLNGSFTRRTRVMELFSPSTSADIPFEQAFYEYLAISHACMSQVRLVPLFPIDRPLTTPFMNAIAEVEAQNGRMIQTQIRMLKDLETPLSLAQREAIIDRHLDTVRELFTELLRSLCVPERREASLFNAAGWIEQLFGANPFVQAVMRNVANNPLFASMLAGRKLP